MALDILRSLEIRAKYSEMLWTDSVPLLPVYIRFGTVGYVLKCGKISIDECWLVLENLTNVIVTIVGLATSHVVYHGRLIKSAWSTFAFSVEKEYIPCAILSKIRWQDTAHDAICVSRSCQQIKIHQEGSYHSYDTTAGDLVSMFADHTDPQMQQQELDYWGPVQLHTLGYSRLHHPMRYSYLYHDIHWYIAICCKICLFVCNITIYGITSETFSFIHVLLRNIVYIVFLFYTFCTNYAYNYAWLNFDNNNNNNNSIISEIYSTSK